MLSVIHHLYRNLHNVFILPTSLEEQFQNHVPLSVNRVEVEHKTEDLKKSLQKEVKLVQDFFQKQITCSEMAEVNNVTDKRILESYKTFRLELNDQEKKSDVLYSQLQNCSVLYGNDDLDNTFDISIC